jgi:hypothetical protein
MRKLGISKAEAEAFHRERGSPPRLTPEEHQMLMQRLGVSKEEEEKWHREHGLPAPDKTEQAKAAEPARETVNPFAVGGGFLSYCVKKGWLVQEGSGRSARYFPTTEGREKLKEFGIKV